MGAPTHATQIPMVSCLLTLSLCPPPSPGRVAASRVLPTAPRASCLPPQVMDQKLSEQRAALEQGQNPLPLYLSLNVKENDLETLDFKGIVFSPAHITLQHTHTHTDTHTYMPPVHPTGFQRIQAANS